MIDVVLPSEIYFCGLSYPWKGWAPLSDPCRSLEPSKPPARGHCRRSQAGEPSLTSQAATAVTFPSELPKSNKTNPFKASIHLNKHYWMNSCPRPRRAQLKLCLISVLWRQAIKQPSCPRTPRSSLADEAFDTGSTDPPDFPFLQSLFWFWEAQPFPPKVYLYCRKWLFNVLCARVYLL